MLILKQSGISIKKSFGFTSFDKDLRLKNIERETERQADGRSDRKEKPKDIMSNDIRHLQT